MALSKQTKGWLAANCLPTLAGKTVVITGGNSGVGYKEAELVRYLGGRVVLACRNPAKAEAAARALQQEYPGEPVLTLPLDLADLSSIDRFAEDIAARRLTIDLFVQNAGVFHHPGEQTKDGFELVLGTNYFGSVYLAEKLLPYLAAQPEKSVYANTISMIHKIGRVDYDDFYYQKHYGNFRVYARSKLCLARYSYDLARRYAGSRVCVLMNHPGIAITPLGLNAFGPLVKKLAGPASHLFNSPEKSALSVPWMLSRSFEPGSIIGPNRLFGGWGNPTQNRVYKKVRQGAPELLAFTQAELQKHR